LLLKIYTVLLEDQGFQSWWPGETNFEVCLGAILTQNTAWANVEKALNNIKKASLMSPDKLLNIGSEKLAGLIRSAGYFNQKTRYIEEFCRFINTTSFSELKKREIHDVREKLLSLKGIGKETADSILLYALDFPIFVIDAYTKRIFSRLNICKEDILYDDVQDVFHKGIVTDVELFKDYHAQIVMLGKNVCRKEPRCDKCVLRANKICYYRI